ncbi:hypothetical protein ACMFMF_007295 [Clarireedia jacksonii]
MEGPSTPTNQTNAWDFDSNSFLTVSSAAPATAIRSSPPVLANTAMDTTTSPMLPATRRFNPKSIYLALRTISAQTPLTQLLDLSPFASQNGLTRLLPLTGTTKYRKYPNPLTSIRPTN